MMTEREYIDATNLAKLRIAIAAIHDCLAMDKKEGSDQSEAQKRLSEWRERLENKVKCDTSDPMSE